MLLERNNRQREQRGTSWELCSPQGTFQGSQLRWAGWHCLVLLHRASPRSPGAASPHPEPSGKRKQGCPCSLARGQSLHQRPPSPPLWEPGAAGWDPVGGPCATSAPSNQPQALAMETSLIFNNIRTAKIPLCLCGQCRGTLRHGGGHPAMERGHSAMEGDTAVPPCPPGLTRTQLCPGSRCCLCPGLGSTPIAV